MGGGPWVWGVTDPRRNVGSIISVYSSRYLVFWATVVSCLILPSRPAHSLPPYEWFTSPVFVISNLSLNFKYLRQKLTYTTTSTSMDVFMSFFFRLLVLLHFAIFLKYKILPFFFSYGFFGIFCFLPFFLQLRICAGFYFF